MNQNSIKWIFILLGLFVTMTFVSCQDDVAQEEQLIKCTPGGSYVKAIYRRLLSTTRFSVKLLCTLILIKSIMVGGRKSIRMPQK